MPLIKLANLLDRCRKTWQRRYAVKPLGQSIDSLQGWFRSDLGKAILAEQQQTLDEILPCLFGYHLMQLSVTPAINLTRESKINHQFGLSPQSMLLDEAPSTAEPGREHQNRLVSAVADFEQLPLPKESVDLAIVHHALDFSAHPHQLLREVSQTIIPHGHLVIVGFNPFSWTGIIKPLKRLLCSDPIWRRHSLRKGRVVDWLRLLDFEVLESYQGFFRFPINHLLSLQYLQGLETLGRRWKCPFGSYYILLARKDTFAVTPINPKWRSVGVSPIMPVANSANSVGSKKHNAKS